MVNISKMRIHDMPKERLIAIWNITSECGMGWINEVKNPYMGICKTNNNHHIRLMYITEP